VADDVMGGKLQILCMPHVSNINITCREYFGVFNSIKCYKNLQPSQACATNVFKTLVHGAFIVYLAKF